MSPNPMVEQVGPVYDEAVVRRITGWDGARPDAEVRAGRVLALTTSDQVTVWPVFQFVEGVVDKRVVDVLAVFTPVGSSGGRCHLVHQPQKGPRWNVANRLDQSQPRRGPCTPSRPGHCPPMGRLTLLSEAEQFSRTAPFGHDGRHLQQSGMLGDPVPRKLPHLRRDASRVVPRRTQHPRVANRFPTLLRLRFCNHLRARRSGSSAAALMTATTRSPNHAGTGPGRP